LSKGLTFRPLDVTARDTLVVQVASARAPIASESWSLAEREAEVLAAWKEQANKSKQESKNSGNEFMVSWFPD
jgi:hypothetical protein